MSRTSTDVATLIGRKPAIIETGYKPGIYFGMTDEEYHGDPALGSSNLRELRNNPCDYWYDSNLNPSRPAEKTTPARIRGKAMHRLVLEGQAPFDREYMRGPDHPEDLSPSQKGALTKEANKEAAAAGKLLLPADDYDRVAIAGAMISRNPELAPAFTGGWPEVSVFWNKAVVDGNGEVRVVRCKVRFDYLKPRGIGDLKSITDWRDDPFPDACHNAIARYRYDMQAAHYLDGRAAFAQLVDAEKIFGTAMAPPDVLTAFCDTVAEQKRFAFQWVFFQAEGAPLTYSKNLSPANPIVEIGHNDIDKALLQYLTFMDRFGPHEMWLLVEKPTELAMEEMPAWWARNRA